jgi:hypothetical protein
MSEYKTQRTPSLNRGSTTSVGASRVNIFIIIRQKRFAIRYEPDLQI